MRKQLAGEPTPQIFRVAAGHGVGKTLGAAALVNWFFDAFAPSIIITTAPTKPAVVEKLWKNIKKMRPPHLPGRVLPADPRMEKGVDHWAIGQTTSNSGGQGTERFQGQHDQYLFFVLDEAEGIPDFVYDAVRAMMTGGKVIIVLVLANPRTRTSRFHKLASESGVKSYTQSVLDFPNVLDGADTIPGGTSREWVISYVNNLCEVAEEHDEDRYTFTLPFDVPITENASSAHGPAGTIFVPNTEFLFRVMGVAPANSADDTLIPSGRYEAATKRMAGEEDPTRARIGIDCAGYGNDMGTIYVHHARVVWRAAQCSKLAGDQDPTDYWQKARKAALALHQAGAKSLHFRIDAGGGFGNGVYDRLKRDEELIQLFPDYQIFMVNFGGIPQDPKAYLDMATQMYAEAAETIRGIAIRNPPEALEGDLTERKFEWVNKGGLEVKKLEPKKTFKKRMSKNGVGRSPDDGDGFVLACAPDFVVRGPGRQIEAD